MFTLTVRDETTRSVWVQEVGSDVPSEIATEEIGDTIREISQRLIAGEIRVLTVEIGMSE